MNAQELSNEVMNAAVNWHIGSMEKDLMGLRKELKHKIDMPEEMRHRLSTLTKELQKLEMDYYFHVSDELEKTYKQEPYK